MATLHYQSARGVYFDIKHSHFTCEVGEFVFYFTSEFNWSRFKDKYEQELIDFKKRVETIYWGNHTLFFDELALIRLYMKLEKRGFLVSYKGELIDCPDNIAFKTELISV